MFHVEPLTFPSLSAFHGNNFGFCCVGTPSTSLSFLLCTCHKFYRKKQIKSSFTCINGNVYISPTDSQCVDPDGRISSKCHVPNVLCISAPLPSSFSSGWSFVCGNTSSQLERFLFYMSGQLWKAPK